MEITDIRECVKNKNRVNLYADGEYICTLFVDTVISHCINKGSNISEENLKIFLAEDEKKYAMSVALRYLNVRMRTKMEIEKKLKMTGFDDDVCGYVTEKLVELGYINDKLFAEMYISELESSYGVRMIERKLFEKGISRDIVSGFCGSLDQKSVACEYLEKYISKHKSEDDKSKLTQKVFRHMAAKGFLFDDIRYAVRNVMNNNEDICD